MAATRAVTTRFREGEVDYWNGSVGAADAGARSFVSTTVFQVARLRYYER